MITLADRGQEVIVDPAAGGRLVSWLTSGHQLLSRARPGDPPTFGGCYPMVPWAGRIGGAAFTFGDLQVRLEADDHPHALHGVAYRRPWTVVDASDSRAVMAFDLSSAAVRRAGWPFGGTARHEIRLDEDRVQLTLRVTAGDADMPGTFGWHPWFVRHLTTPAPVGGGQREHGPRPPVEGVVHPSVRTMWERGPDNLPTGRLVPAAGRPWDDAFPQPDGVRASVRWEGIGQVNITSDATTVVIYEQDPRGLCIEPQTGPPDAVHHAPVILPARGTASASVTLSFRPADQMAG